MDESRHDFLAGARFTGQQNGRLGMRDPRRVRQDVLPLSRSAHNTPLTGARFELAGQGGDLRFESCGGLTRFCMTARGLREPLVRQRQREVIGDTPAELYVVLGERLRLS